MKKKMNMTLVVICLVLALGFMIGLATMLKSGPGSMVSKASRDTTLTVGDDALSLQQDLTNLSVDPGTNAEQELNAIQ